MLKFLPLFIAVILVQFLENSLFSQEGKNAPVAAKVYFDKASYLPSAPVFLIVSLANTSDEAVYLVDGDNLPFRGEKQAGAGGESFAMEGMLDGAVLKIKSSPDGEASKDLYPSEEAKGVGSSQADEVLTILNPHQTKYWKKRLPFNFSKTGKYIFDFHNPRLAAISKKGTYSVDLNRELELNVIPESETIKGFVPEVVLSSKPVNGVKVQTLVWAITPPKDRTYTSPKTQNGNCRIILRDENGAIIRDVVTQPYGAGSIGRDSWDEKIAWELPLRFASFYGLKKPDFIPRPGKYTIEAFFRDFLPLKQENSEISDDGDAYFSDLAKSAESLPSAFRQVESAPSSAVQGNWITFKETIKTEITSEDLRALGKLDSAPK